MKNNRWRLEAFRGRISAAMTRGSAALLLLLGTVAYVIAEDITVTTFYPSPRGVYNNLRTMGQTTLAETGGNVGIGTASPAVKFYLSGSNPDVYIPGASTSDSARLIFFDKDVGAAIGLLNAVGQPVVRML